MHRRILAVVRRIPRGRVATYGQIARIARIGAQPRLVGYALAALPDDSDVPWHRVVNAQGKISPRATPGADRLQRALLEREGIRFDARDRIELARFGVTLPATAAATVPRSLGRSMARGSWLVKTEPSTYSWDDLVRDGGTRWDGVRNALARTHLGAMKRGDLVLVYHSGDQKAVVGIAKVTRSAYPDPKADDARWLAIDLAPVRALAAPVSLATVKADAKLAAIALVRQSRLSVQPLDASAFARILGHAKTPVPR